jgi:outer membrane protein assembly factor BamB
VIRHGKPMEPKIVPMQRPTHVWTATLAALSLWLGVGHAGAQAYLDESLTAQEMIEQAASLRDRGRVPDAITLLTEVVAKHPEKLLPTGGGAYTDTRVRVRQMIADDPALLEAYRQRNAASAQRALELAFTDGPDAVALQKVLRDYGLTRSGLDAGLALAGLYLERGDGAGARSVLEVIAGHPDLTERQAEYHHAAAVAALLLNDRAAFDVQRMAAENAGSSDLATLDQLATKLLSDPAGRESTALPSREKPLWRYQFFDEPPDDEDPNLRNLRRNQGTPANGLHAGYTTAPRTAGTMVLLNEGRSLHAVDADSGRPLWRYDVSEDDEPSAETDPRRALIIRMRLMRMGGEVRGAAVEGRRVFAVLGTPAQMRLSRNRPDSASASRLVSLDRRTGQEVWSVSAADVGGSSMESAHFDGTPIIAFGRVFVLMSRQPGGNAEDTFLACVEAESGERVWVRHVAGQSQLRSGIRQPAPSMLLSGNRVYVCDSLSVVACLDARTGLIYWARLLQAERSGDVDPRRVRVSSSQYRDVGPPVMVEAGLLVPVGSQEHEGTLLNPVTGEVRRVLRDWPEDAMLLSLDGDALVIGEQVLRLNGKTLGEKWTTPLGTNDVARKQMGRPAVAGDVLVVPTAAGLQLINTRNGEALEMLESVKGGNITWRRGALFVADDQRLHVIDDWEAARQRLLARADTNQTDPDAGLALAHLALSQGDDDAVIEGIDQAIFAADMNALTHGGDAGGEVQRRVFKQVLAFTDQSMGGSDTLRRAMFDRLATLTNGPTDEVAYHLALGAFLAEPAVDRPGEAVVHYQAILDTADLADQVFERDGYRRQAGIEARRRVHQLVKKHGPQIYRRFEELAATEYEQLLASNADARQHIALARSYPLAETAARAHLRAATILAEDGDHAGAATQFRLAYEQARDTALRVAAASRLATQYESQGQPRRGMRWLDRVARDLPDVKLERRGTPISADAWSDALAAMPETHAELPRISPDIQRTSRVSGHIVPTVATPHTASAPDRFLTIDGPTLRLHARPDQPPLWSVGTDIDDAIALGVSAEQVLLFSSERGVLTALNGRNGEPDWPARHIASLLREVSEEDRLPEDRNRVEPELLELITPGNRRGERRVVDVALGNERPIENIRVRASESVVVLADAAGRAVGIDRYTGSVLWRLRSPIDELAGMTLGEDAVALYGNSYAADSAHAGRLLVLDLVTGRPRIPTIHLGASLPRWSAFTGRNKLVLIDLAGVVAYDLNNAQVAWRTNPSTLPLTGEAWAGGQRVIVPDSGGVAHLIDADTGKVTRRISAEARRRSPPSDARLVDNAAYLLAAGSVVALDEQGRVAWRDATDPDLRGFVRQWVGRTHLAVLSIVPARPTDEQREPSRRLFFFERDSGRLVAQYRLGAPIGAIDAQASQLIDDALLLSTDQGVIALPMQRPES